MLRQEAAINALIPKAERLATLAINYDQSEQRSYEHPRHGKVKYTHFKWTELFHKYMNELAKEAGLR